MTVFTALPTTPIRILDKTSPIRKAALNGVKQKIKILWNEKLVQSKMYHE